MFFCDNLEEIIFTRHEILENDELVVLSGYLGPTPVERLGNLPFHTKVIYGMYASDGIQAQLHNQLILLNRQIEIIDVRYSTTPIHSKCYAWKRNGQIIHALIGSANFSISGLRTPYKEILAETTRDTFASLNTYINYIIDNSIPCTDGVIRERRTRPNDQQPEVPLNPDVCTMALYDPRTNEVQDGNGLNWGLATGSHVNPDDANIPIRTPYIREYPRLFPEKLLLPHAATDAGRPNRHNDEIEIIWDDGIRMTGLLEGNNPMDGRIYPKQICSSRSKSELGRYFRGRIGVPSGQHIRMADLHRYGRTSIDVSLLGEGVYYFDFASQRFR